MDLNRRNFVGAGFGFFAAAGLNAFGAVAPKDKDGKLIGGFDETNAGKISKQPWKPFSDKKPVVDVACAVNMTLPGLYMHRSAAKGGEWLNFPHVTP